MRTVTDDLRAATATVLTRIAYYSANLAVSLDLPAMLVEMQRLQIKERERKAKQVEQQIVGSMRNGESFMGRN